MSYNAGTVIINAPLYVRGVVSLISTNYSVSYSDNDATVVTSDGSSFTISAATSLVAGLMSAEQVALLYSKADAIALNEHESDADIHHTAASLDARDTANRARANHTGTQAQSTVDNLVTDLADKLSKSAGGTITFTAIPDEE